MSDISPDVALPTSFGLYPVPESETWSVRPGDLVRNPDYTYANRLAEEQRERAAAFLVLCSQRNPNGEWCKPGEGTWKSVSWLRLSHTVLQRADPDRYRSALAWEDRWDWLTVGVYRKLHGPPLGLPNEMPFHSAGHTLTPARKLPWGGDWVQQVADGLHELCEQGLVVRHDTRGPSPVFSPTERLVQLLAQYRRPLRSTL